MKYLRKFETEAEKDAWLNSAKHVKPNVVLIGETGKVEYNVYVDYTKMPLFIEAIDDVTISFSNTYEYSKNNEVWDSGTSSVVVSATAGERVFFRASGLTPNSSSGIGKFTINNGKCNVGGNIMSMVYGGDYEGKTELTAAYQFFSLFSGASTIVDSGTLVLPATTLKESCYNGMFYGCTSLVNAPELPATTMAISCYKRLFYNCKSLVNAPELPATTLTNSCYSEMFYGCKSLVNAPELPATNLGYYCYNSMFYNCTSLVNAPELPATTLIDSCYDSMFYGCTSLVNAPELPATTLETDCYKRLFYNCTSLVNAPELPATTLATYCYFEMFYGCSSLVNAPELPATTLKTSCYSSMFYRCKSLVNAPELPATTLVTSCYDDLFAYCSKLKYVKAMFTTTPGSTYTSYWLGSVSATGTFVKNAAATWDVTGTSGIPRGWTVETAAA